MRYGLRLRIGLILLCWGVMSSIMAFPVDMDWTLWDSMRGHFALSSSTYRPEVKKEIQWLQQHNRSTYRTLAKSAPYLYSIYQQTQKRHLPAELVLIPLIESEFNPFAYSHMGATGLWQMMPGTASGLGLKINWWYDGRRDLVASTDRALYYLTYLYNFFDQDWLMAVAAYDAGEGTVQNAIDNNILHERDTDVWDLNLPKETQSYVPKLLALAAIIHRPEYYDMQLPNISDEPYLQTVNVGSQIELKTAAKLAGMSLKTLRKLNPGFRRWATDPGGPHTLLIPIDNVSHFQQGLVSLPKAKRVTWRRHTVKPGDSLSKIAIQYHSRVLIIKNVNKLKNDTIRIHQKLLIPKSRHLFSFPNLHRQPAIDEDRIPGPRLVQHTVKNSDSLSKIANRYHVNIRQIQYWNQLKHNGILQNGQILHIWRPHHNHAIQHIVKPGDTLSQLAEHYKTYIKTIKSANHIKNNVIKIGQELTIPI